MNRMHSNDPRGIMVEPIRDDEKELDEPPKKPWYTYL